MTSIKQTKTRYYTCTVRILILTNIFWGQTQDSVALSVFYDNMGKGFGLMELQEHLFKKINSLPFFTKCSTDINIYFFLIRLGFFSNIQTSGIKIDEESVFRSVV